MTHNAHQCSHLRFLEDKYSFLENGVTKLKAKLEYGYQRINKLNVAGMEARTLLQNMRAEAEKKAGNKKEFLSEEAIMILLNAIRSALRYQEDDNKRFVKQIAMDEEEMGNVAEEYYELVPPVF